MERRKSIAGNRVEGRNRGARQSIAVLTAACALLSVRTAEAFTRSCTGSTQAACNLQCTQQRTCSVGNVCYQQGPVCALNADGFYEGTISWACCNAQGDIIADPHMRTFDGLLYDYQAVGEFVAVESGGLVLQVRQQAWGGCASVAVAAATTLGANRVAVYALKTPHLWIDGNPTDVSCTSRPPETSGVVPVTAGATYTSCLVGISFADGSRIDFHVDDGVSTYTLTRADDAGSVRIAVRPGGYLDTSVSVAAASRARTVGLLGTPDGDTSNDLRSRDGRIMPQPITFNQLYQDFGESWRLAQEESLFDYAPGEDTETFTDRGFPAAPCPPLPEAERLAAEKTCQAAGITNRDLLEACIFDIGVTGDARFAKSFSGIAAPVGRLGLQDNSTAPKGSATTFARRSFGCSLSRETPSTVGLCVFPIFALLYWRTRRRIR